MDGRAGPGRRRRRDRTGAAGCPRAARDPAAHLREARRAGDAVAHAMEVLADRAALLVLDNCEHLIDAVAAAGRATARAGARVCAILTHQPRAAGHHRGDVVPVAPLASPTAELSAAEALEVPAVRLFADRAAAASAGFAVDEDTVGGVVEICRRVDGLPLAIELAAARLRTMPLGSSPTASTTASGCSPAAAAPRWRASARCGRSWTGAGTCSPTPSGAARAAWRCSRPARRWRRPRPSAPAVRCGRRRSPTC